MTEPHQQNQAAPLERIKAIARALARQPVFLVAVAVLGVTAIGFNAATRALQLHFQKLPVPLAPEALRKLPAEIGPWRQAMEDLPLETDVEEILAAKQYVFRDYIDSRLVERDRLAAMKDRNKPRAERTKQLTEIERTTPSAVVHLAVTYYTGMVDTVAHIPDRCYIAGGFQPREYQVKTWQVRDPKSKDGAIEVRYISFEDQTGFSSHVSRNVAYFFQVNGEETSNPLDVRARLQNLWEKYGYYAKIELMSLDTDRLQSERVMVDFLSSAMPEVEKCLPDWQAINRAGVK